MLAISRHRVELGAVLPSVRALGARTLAAWSLAALILTACERPTAPVALVYADRPVGISALSGGGGGVSGGGAHGCGIRTDDRLYCWGSNASGQLGVVNARGQCLRTPASC